MQAPKGYAQTMQALATGHKRPDGSPYQGLGEAQAALLAQDFACPLREVQAWALDHEVWPLRYVRNSQTLDAAAQARLLRSQVALVGLGGLGGTVLELLCRAGVGRIRAADGDRFEESNLNRQLLATGSTLDQSKAQTAYQHAQALNPAVELDVRETYLNQDDMCGLLEKTHVAIDALGGLDDRPALARAASQSNIALVTAAIAGNSGYVATVMPGQSGPTALLGSGAGAEDTLGSPGPAVTVAAALMVQEALTLAQGLAPTLDKKMLVFDLADMTFETISL